jgi:hypothetical protein
MLCLVALVRTDVSEERNASIITVTKISAPVRMLAVTGSRRSCEEVQVRKGAGMEYQILVTFMMEALSSSEMSVLTSATWRYHLRRLHSS